MSGVRHDLQLELMSPSTSKISDKKRIMFVGYCLRVHIFVHTKYLYRTRLGIHQASCCVGTVLISQFSPGFGTKASVPAVPCTIQACVKVLHLWPD